MTASEKMRPVRFGFEGVGPFDGLTDGSTWNGFLNVWVTAEEHEKVLQAFRDNNMEGDDDEQLAGLEPGDDGLVSYANGFVASEWCSDDPIEIAAQSDLEDAIRAAQEAFWAEIAKQYPTATSGDFPPDATMEFDEACTLAVKTWTHYNVTEDTS